MARKKQAPRRFVATGRVTKSTDKLAAGAELSVRGAALTPVSANPDTAVRTVRVAAGYPDMWRIDLHNLQEQRRRLRDREQAIVAQAIAAGATWSAIGRCLGISRQSAHARFRFLEPVVAPPIAGASDRADHLGS